MSPPDGGPTRATVVAAASALLESGGPDAVTLRAVGAAAGVSRSTPYRHFQDKADLLAALALQTLNDLGAAISEASSRGGDGALPRACFAYVRYAVEHSHHYMLVFGDTPMAEPSAAIEEAADAGMGALGVLVERAQADGELGDGPPREMATMLWALLHGLAQLQITGHLREPRTVQGDDGLRQLVTLALTALRPTQP